MSKKNNEPGTDNVPGSKNQTEPADSNMIAATVQVIPHKTTEALSVGVNEILDLSVEVEFQYPKEYKGERFFSDGDKRNVSAECAEQFQALGIIKPISGK